MKVLIIGVDSLPNYKNKHDQLDPSVIVHIIKKTDNGFAATKRAAFLSTSSVTFSEMLKKAGNIESMVGYYASADFNEAGYLDDLTLIEPSGMTIPWKK